MPETLREVVPSRQALGGQGETATASHEKRRPQCLFQLGHELLHGGAGDAEFLGGESITQVPRDGFKRPKGIQ